jgi:hypothetical protein
MPFLPIRKSPGSVAHKSQGLTMRDRLVDPSFDALEMQAFNRLIHRLEREASFIADGWDELDPVRQLGLERWQDRH